MMLPSCTRIVLARHVCSRMGKGFVAACAGAKGKAKEPKASVKKTIGKTKKDGNQKITRLSVEEKRIAREMHFDRHMTPTDVAIALGRHLSSITRLFAQKRIPNRIGRPKALTEKMIDKLEKTLEAMVEKADGEEEVTLQMLMKKAKPKACIRVVQDALHKRGFWFRDLREKPILTPGDVELRFAFAKKHKDKTPEWWCRKVHIHLDNHAFKVATRVRGRRLLAKRRVRGVYRKKGKGLSLAHVRPGRKLRLPTGSKSILIGGGVGGGKVLVWHHIEDNWCGAEAARFYKDAVKPALCKRYPGQKKFVILEDNDPTGNFSGAGKKAKKDEKMEPLIIPTRSPDLNVLDYAIWSEVERRMRLQERPFPEGKVESRMEFKERMARVARNLPTSFINKSIGNLAVRCQKLYKAKGGLFEEGGKKNRRRPL